MRLREICAYCLQAVIVDVRPGFLSATPGVVFGLFRQKCLRLRRHGTVGNRISLEQQVEGNGQQVAHDKGLMDIVAAIPVLQRRIYLRTRSCLTTEYSDENSRINGKFNTAGEMSLEQPDGRSREVGEVGEGPFSGPCRCRRGRTSGGT